MVNFSLHLSGPKIHALIALANGELRQRSGVVINGLAREGLVQIQTVESEQAEGILLDAPFLTERGRTVLGLIEADVIQYLSKVRAKKAKH